MILDTCSRCGGDIYVIFCREGKELIVSHGECACCGKVIILPQVTMAEFRRDLGRD